MSIHIQLSEGPNDDKYVVTVADVNHVSGRYVITLQDLVELHQQTADVIVGLVAGSRSAVIGLAEELQQQLDVIRKDVRTLDARLDIVQGK